MKINQDFLIRLIMWAFLFGALMGFISGYLIELMYAHAECYNILTYTRRYTCDNLFLSYEGFRKFAMNTIEDHNAVKNYVEEMYPPVYDDNLTFDDYDTNKTQ
jgi:hypothetical protein